MAKRKTQTVVRRQATNGSRPTPLKCWVCGSQLALWGDRLECPRRDSRLPAADGIFDLWPPGRRPPRLDTYATPFGAAYDFGVNRPALARVAARIEYGADVARMYEWMAEVLDCPPGRVVLDVPAGGGTLFSRGAPKLDGLLVGIDLSRAMLARAARRRRALGLEQHVLLVRGDAARLPVVTAGVDRVACFNGLHVIPDKGAALAEFRRVLKAGGELLGTTLVSDPPGFYRNVIGLARLAGFFVPPGADQVAGLAKRAGFERWEQKLDGALLYFRGQ